MKARRFIGLAALIVAVIPVAALARDCNEVRAEIDFKDHGKGCHELCVGGRRRSGCERREDRRHLRWRGEANRVSETNPSGPNKLALEEKPAAPKKGTQISE